MTKGASDLSGRDGHVPWQGLTSIFASRSAKEHGAHLVPYLKPNMRILDVGCGLGSITVDLANLTPSGEVIGLDTNAATTKAAKEMAAAKKVSNVTFVEGDAQDLSQYASNSFDIVHAHQVVLHLSKPMKALSEMRRVLKPNGGILAIRDNISLSYFPRSPAMDRNQRWFEAYSKERGGNPGAGTYTHLWVHQTGFEWSEILFGSVAWELSGSRDIRRACADSMKSSSRPALEAAGYGSQAEYNENEEAWEAWAQKEEARILGHDGWVLARKYYD